MKVTAVQLQAMHVLVDECDARIAMIAPKNVSLASGPSQSSDSPSRKRGNSTLRESYGMEARDKLDCLIARMFFTGGLPFNLARNPYFVEPFKHAANNKMSSYVPSGFNKIRTSLLDQERAHVEFLLQPVKKTWPEKGISIVSDGWSDPQRRPLINFMAVSGGGPMFIKSVNFVGQVKDKHFIANLMKEVIDEVGHQNVVQVMTDNAANCKAAGEIIEGIYPHIYWTPCVVHTLNLALKNICAPRDSESNKVTYGLCNWITEVYATVMQIKNFIMNHGMRLSMYNKFTPLKLLSVADTRFASVVIMLKRFKLIRRALETMVMSDGG